MRMGMFFSCPFQGALWKLAYNTPCLSQNTEMRSSEMYVLTLRVAILRLSNVEKITSAILPLARNILYTPLPFRLFSNLSSVTMPALLLRISSKIAQKCRCKIAELILSTLLKVFVLSQEIPNLATVSRCSKLFYNPQIRN